MVWTPHESCRSMSYQICLNNLRSFEHLELEIWPNYRTVFQFRLHQHLFSKFDPLFVLLISILKLINQSFYLCDRPAFKMNIYHKLKVSYIIRYVIIKHALVKKLLILQVQNDDIKPWKKNALLSTNQLYYMKWWYL